MCANLMLEEVVGAVDWAAHNLLLLSLAFVAQWRCWQNCPSNPDGHRPIEIVEIVPNFAVVPPPPLVANSWLRNGTTALVVVDNAGRHV